MGTRTLGRAALGVAVLSVGAAACLAAVRAAPAQSNVAAARAAALAGVPGRTTQLHACKYLYDGYWRDLPVTLSATPGALSAAPGAKVTIGNVGVSAVLPDWLQEYGYQFGLLEPGRNAIPARIWIALSASGTREGTIVRQLAAKVSTTIKVRSGAVSATPFTIRIPSFDTTWTATGGRIEFGEAGPGTLGKISAGGAAITPAGSVYVTAKLGSVRFDLDCQPGDAAKSGESFAAAAPRPTSRIAVPAVECISTLAAQPSREIEPLWLDVEGRAPATVAKNGRATLSGTTLALTPPLGYLRALYGAGGSSPLLAAGLNTFPLAAWVSIAGERTKEGAQTVHATGTWEVAVDDPTPASRTNGDERITTRTVTLALPDTTWTSAGSGPLTFRLGPGGAISATTSLANVNAYGSVLLELSTRRDAALLDCVPGTVAVANASIPFSPRGRNQQPNGSGGRYAVVPMPAQPIARIPAGTPKSSTS